MQYATNPAMDRTSTVGFELTPEQARVHRESAHRRTDRAGGRRIRMSILEYETPHYQPDEGRMRGFSLHQPWASLIAETSRRCTRREGGRPRRTCGSPSMPRRSRTSEFRGKPGRHRRHRRVPASPRSDRRGGVGGSGRPSREHLPQDSPSPSSRFGDFSPWAVGMASSTPCSRSPPPSHAVAIKDSGASLMGCKQR